MKNFFILQLLLLLTFNGTMLGMRASKLIAYKNQQRTYSNQVNNKTFTEVIYNSEVVYDDELQKMKDKALKGESYILRSRSEDDSNQNKRSFYVWDNK
jgi:hypothetical protein